MILFAQTHVIFSFGGDSIDSSKSWIVIWMETNRIFGSFINGRYVAYKPRDIV